VVGRRTGFPSAQEIAQGAVRDHPHSWHIPTSRRLCQRRAFRSLRWRDDHIVWCKGAAGFCIIEFGALKGRFSKHPEIRFGELYRLKLYKKPAIRELQMLMFLARKMILQ